jgi:hypothetical protein
MLNYNDDDIIPPIVDLVVTQNDNSKVLTSLNRLVPHIVIELREQAATHLAAAHTTTASSSTNNTTTTWLGRTNESNENEIVHTVSKQHSHENAPDRNGKTPISPTEPSPPPPNNDTLTTPIPQPPSPPPFTSPGTYITIYIPEKTNLVCDLAAGSIAVTGKVEGDVRFSTHGNIAVTKLRGHTISLTTKHSNHHHSIFVSQLLEAQTMVLQCHGGGRLRAQQLHGHSIAITTTTHDDDNTGNRDDDAMGRGDTTATSSSNATRTPGEPVAAAAAALHKLDDDDEGSVVDISSLFVSGGGGATITVDNRTEHSSEKDHHQQHHTAPLQPRRAVRVKSHHGPVKVNVSHGKRPTQVNPFTGTTYPMVELGGVNGSCEVSIQDTYLPDDGDDVDHWASCLIHVDSLAPDTVSLVTADQGNIAVTVDRKVESDLRLASLSDSTCLLEAGALLAEEDDGTLLTSVLRNLAILRPDRPTRAMPRDDGIAINTKAFTPRPENAIRTESVVYVDGWIDNKSDEPDSRFDRKVRGIDSVGRGAGKIRHDSAENQALYSFSNQVHSDDNELGHPPDEGNHNQRPLMAVVGTRRVALETLSWMGAIARRYGLEEEGSDRSLGRTASRRGRPLV